MADTAFGSQVRGYLDTINSQKGINWKDISRHVNSGGDRRSLEQWLFDKYGMDRNEAKKYTAAALYTFGNYTEQDKAGLQQRELGDLTPPGSPEAAPVDPNEQERVQLTDWIKNFTQSLGRPVDMNDPVFASLSNLGAARASMNVGASGIRVGRGGLGELAIQQGSMNAVQPYLQQRRQMEMQGLGMLDTNQRGNEALRQGAYGLNLQRQQMQNNINQQMYGGQADAAGGVGGAIGGALGALGTAGLAMIPGVGPAIATAAGPGLIKGFSSVGAGAGMGSVQRPTYSSPRPYGSFGRGGNGY
jgi:hypothetical protein